MIIFIKGSVIVKGENLKGSTQDFPDNEAERLISLGVAEKVLELTAEQKENLAQEAELISTPEEEEKAGESFKHLTEKIKTYKELTVKGQKIIIQKAKTIEALERMKKQSWQSVLPEIDKKIKELQEEAGNE